MRELNEEQRQAVKHTDGPLLIVAGAGTGKTRVMVEKVGHLLKTVPGLRAENILALTFTDKAAEEMRQRAARQYGEEARACRFATFHSFCNELLSSGAVGERTWKAVDQIDHWIFLRRNLETLELDHYFRASEPGRFLNDLLVFCSRCQDNLVSPAEFLDYVEKLAASPLEMAGGGAPAQAPSKRKSKAKPKASPEETVERLREVARVYARSEQLLEQAGLVTFDAMISRTIALLKSSPARLGDVQRRYRFILVDEFQDTNWAQIELLRLLAGEKMNLTAVGDRKQAIYHFRGASRASFDLFKEKFPKTSSVALSWNYRSTKSILAVAGAVIAHSPERYGEDESLTTSRDLDRKVDVLEFADDYEQAEFLAREMARQVKAGEARAYSEFAVLYRAHNHRNLLVKALRRHEVPFSIRKLAINNLAAVRDILAYLRAIGDPRDSVSLMRVLSDSRWKIDGAVVQELCRAAYDKRCPLSEVVEPAAGEESAASAAPGLVKVVELLGRYREIAKEQRIGVWLPQIQSELNLFAKPKDMPAWNAFLRFVLTWDKEKSTAGLLAEFLEYFAYFEEANATINLPDEAENTASISPASKQTLPSRRQQGALWEDAPPEDPQGKVQLMTVHGAKGLEFEKVFVLQVVRNAFPMRRQSPLISFPVALLKGPAPEGDPHVEEERRLFYVALTRAKDSLTLCTVSNARQHPSPFLEQLQNSNLEELSWKTVASQGAPREPSPSAPLPATAPASPGELSLSPSAIETYGECPLKYYYSSVCRVPVMPSAALRFGSIMHDSIRELIGTLAKKPQAIGTTAIETEIEKILRAHWSPTGFTDAVQERKYWEMGLEQLQGLWQAASKKPFELLFQEKPFQFACGGARIGGRIDQINRIAGKQVEIVEYKTGRAQTQKDADRSLQLTIYARACRDALGYELASLVLYNLANQEELRTQRGPAEFSELDATVSDTAEGIAAGRFPANKGFQCGYCDFRPICPAHEE